MKKARPLISLRPGVSRCLAGFIAISHLLAGMALFLSDLHGLLRMLLLVLVLLSCCLSWRKSIVPSAARAIVQTDWLPDGNWRVVYGDESVQQVASWTLLLNTPALLMLNFKVTGNGAATLIICPDSMDREARRRLRVSLTTG